MTLHKAAFAMLLFTLAGTPSSAEQGRSPEQWASFCDACFAYLEFPSGEQIEALSKRDRREAVTPIVIAPKGGSVLTERADLGVAPAQH